MINIRDKFINKLKAIASDSIGSFVILQIGIKEHQKIAKLHPNSKIHVGAGAPGATGVRSVKYAPTHGGIQTTLTNNGNMVFELFLAELVQTWFDFLADIYEKALLDSLNGIQSYSIPASKTKVNFSLSGPLLTQQIKEAACKDFDFLPAKEKLKTIKDTLGENLSGQSAQLDTIKINIKVRNILQHSNRVVSTEDLSDLGASGIEEDHGNSTNVVTAGQKISRTSYDIENFVDAMVDVAYVLIP